MAAVPFNGPTGQPPPVFGAAPPAFGAASQPGPAPFVFGSAQPSVPAAPNAFGAGDAGGMTLGRGAETQAAKSRKVVRAKRPGGARR